MKRLIEYAVIILLVAACASNTETKHQEDDWRIPTTGYSTPESYPEMNLVWQDEFERDDLNLADWKHEIGGMGWDNNELQYYQEKNATVRDGYLIITAKKEDVGGRNYTSSRIITQGKKNFNMDVLISVHSFPRGKVFGRRCGC